MSILAAGGPDVAEQARSVVVIVASGGMGIGLLAGFGVGVTSVTNRPRWCAVGVVFGLVAFLGLLYFGVKAI